MEQKTIKPIQSKTVWANILLALSPLIPGVDTFISQNPEVIPLIIGAVNVGLRLITKSAISLQ